MARLALIGDYDARKTAHLAIPQALELARKSTGANLDWEWIGTDRVFNPAETLADFAGVWVTPGSPYASMDGALAATRHARERNLPFLGTCGGFQHALIEFARNVAGITAADHAETARNSCNLLGYKLSEPDLVITALTCSLVGQTGGITFAPGSRLHGIFGGRPVLEGYHCNYGVNPAYRARLEADGLRFTGFAMAGLPSETTRPELSPEMFARLAKDGDIRTFELPGHRFFLGTLFQPERSALRGASHPLIEAFVAAL